MGCTASAPVNAEMAETPRGTKGETSAGMTPGGPGLVTRSASVHTAQGNSPRDHGPVLSLRGHSERVNAVAFTRDGSTLFSLGDDGSMRAWRNLAGAGNTSAPPISTRYVIGSHVNAVAIIPPPPKQFMKDISPVPDGAVRLVTACDNGIVEVWEAGDNYLTCLATLYGHTSWVSSVIVLGYFEDEVLVPILKQPSQHEVRHPDPSILGSSLNSPGSITYVPRQTEQPKQTLHDKRSFKHHTLERRVFLRVASGGGDGKVGVWDVAVGPNKDFRPSPSFRPTDMRAFTHTLTKHSNWVTGVAAIARTSVRAGFEDLNLHDYVVSVCWDRKVRLWHIPSRTEVSCSAPLDTGLQCVAVLPSSSPHRMPSSDEEDRDPSGGTRVILAGEQHDHDGTGTPGQKLPPLAHRRGAESPPNVVMAHRGSPQVTQDRYHPRSDDDNSSDDLELVRAPRRSTVGSVVVGLRPFLQDATMPVLAAVGTQDGRVVIYDLSTGSIVRQCQPHVSAVTAITPSSSGKEIVSCSGDGTVKVLSSRLHSLATLLVPLNRRALCVAMIARHTRYVAVGSSDATVHLFELSV